MSDFQRTPEQEARARELLARVESDSASAEDHHELGMIHLDTGAPHQAIDHFDRAIATEHHPEAYHARGFAHLTLGNHSQAIEDTHEAIKRNPELSSENALVAKKLKDLELQLDDKTDLIEATLVDLAKRYNDRAMTYIKLADMESALMDLNEAINHFSHFAHAYNNRAFVKMNMGDLNGAYEDVEYALSIDPLLDVANLKAIQSLRVAS